jgi:porin
VVDVVGVAQGGVRRAASTLANVDLLLTVDGERLLGWRGFGAFVYGLVDAGGDPSRDVGDLHGVDDVATVPAAKLYEAWLQQTVLDGRLAILAGLYDLNAEFDLLESASPFLNGAFGMGAEYAQTGRNGPSTFPNAPLGARLKLGDVPVAGSYLQAAVLDGVPGDPADPGAFAVDLSAADGALLAWEGGWRRGLDDRAVPLAKIGLGGWAYTAPQDTIAPAAAVRRRRGDVGAYALAEWQAWQAPRGDGLPGVTLFGRVGRAATRFNRIGWFLEAGATWTGPWPARADDALALGVAWSLVGSAWRRTVRAAGGTPVGGETTVELTYVLQLLPWLALQPDVQWVRTPADAPGVPDALVLAGRIAIGF